MQHVGSLDGDEQRQVADNRVGFGGDGEIAALAFGEDFEDGAGSAEAALGRLIGIGCGADGYRLIWGYFAQVSAQQRGGVGLGVDLVFEFAGVEVHEFVRVAGVAVAASELAAAVGVDRPFEGQARFGAVEEAAGGEFEVLYLALGFQSLAFRGQFRDADQHFLMFSFCSLCVKAP